jgi:4-amino-4-deoxy-L-arabinose transferase-like glycosyltransferase
VPAPCNDQYRHWLLLGLVVLAGLGLRFYRLGELPAGLYQDEAFNGLDALNVIGGARPVFFSANNGREPFYNYLVAASVAALGRSPLAVRLPAALVGALTIPAAYALGRALFGRRLGLLAAAVTALTFWPVALSRIGLRAGSLPLFLALGLACAAFGWRAKPRRLGLLALGGALYGFTFYTYLAARFVPLALFAFLVFWYSAQRQTFPTARELAAFIVPAVLVALPLLLAGLSQPEILLGRAGQVSVLNPAINHGDLWGTLARNVAAALGMFAWRGDTIARHNLPGRPVFDLFLGAAFLAGVVRLGRQALQKRHLASALLLIWAGTLLLPTILAEDTPHFLRAVGVLPASLLVAASGLDWLWQANARYPALRQSLVMAALAAAGLWTARDYFVRYAAAPDTRYLFQWAATKLADEVQTAVTQGQAVYVDQRYWDNFASVRFLVGDLTEPHWYSTPEQVRPTGVAETVVIAWPYEAVGPVVAGLPVRQVLWAEPGPLYRGDLEPEPYPLYAVYRAQPAAAVIGEPSEPLARFEGGLNLLAYDAVPAPGGGRVSLVWQAEQAPGRDYQVFAQALRGEALVAQADGPLGTALLPSSLWRPGERVGETRAFVLPAQGAWAGTTIRLGLYDLATGARLQRADQPGDTFEFIAESGER